MRVYKTIKGEKVPYSVRFVPHKMTAEVRYFMSDSPTIGIISEDFKYIIMPDDFLSPYISGVGKVKIGKLKLDRINRSHAIDHNEGQH